MQIDELNQVIRTAGGGDHALAYAAAFLEKVNCIESAAMHPALLGQLFVARDQGDFRGRVLEVNFSDYFLRKGISIGYGAKQGMPGDIDFVWDVEGYKIYIELKLLGQGNATRNTINAQIEDKGAKVMFLNDDTRDVARLQENLIQKASVKKFNPKPFANSINLVGIDVTELQLGTVDICDCLLAAGGNSMAAQHCDPACLRNPIIGAFEIIAPEKLSASQRDWVVGVQRVPAGAPHPRDYIHGALFLFREPQERAALSYDLRAAIVWNSALVSADVAKRICGAFHAVIPQAK